MPAGKRSHRQEKSSSTPKAAVPAAVQRTLDCGESRQAHHRFGIAGRFPGKSPPRCPPRPRIHACRERSPFEEKFHSNPKAAMLAAVQRTLDCGESRQAHHRFGIAGRFPGKSPPRCPPRPRIHACRERSPFEEKFHSNPKAAMLAAVQRFSNPRTPSEIIFNIEPVSPERVNRFLKRRTRVP
jgi:hypothetical protein